jgi:hypothetical protein
MQYLVAIDTIAKGYFPASGWDARLDGNGGVTCRRTADAAAAPANNQGGDR